jgi:hypothetical protein
MFDKHQFKDLIVRVLSEHPELLSDSAINLLLGTAAQESQFGRYLRQIGGGPALGVFQMEPETFEWLRSVYFDVYPEISTRQSEELEWDLKLATLFARLRYRVIPSKLPGADDIPALAKYWNDHYNANPNAGTDAEFIENYHRFVS